MKKIYVTGFPHSGTSILRVKLGEGKNVFEQEQESPYPLHLEEFEKSNKEFYLWKRPIHLNLVDNPFDSIVKYGFKYKSESYFKDDYIVFIMRSPYFSYSSIYEIFKNEFGESKAAESLVDNFTRHFIPTAKLFLDAKYNSYDKVYTIYYEEMFENNNKLLKELMNSIGIKQEVSIDETKKHFIGKIPYEENQIPNTKPDQYLEDPGYYRTWQINQPFSNFNNVNKINLPQELIDVLDNSEIVKELGYRNPL